jgi:hypothetical protein
VARLRISTSIVFESGARIDPGKPRLLENIRETGSISGDARWMGTSLGARVDAKISLWQIGDTTTTPHYGASDRAYWCAVPEMSAQR